MWANACRRRSSVVATRGVFGVASQSNIANHGAAIGNSHYNSFPINDADIDSGNAVPDGSAAAPTTAVASTATTTSPDPMPAAAALEGLALSLVPVADVLEPTGLGWVYR